MKEFDVQADLHSCSATVAADGVVASSGPQGDELECWHCADGSAELVDDVATAAAMEAQSVELSRLAAEALKQPVLLAALL